MNEHCARSILMLEHIVTGQVAALARNIAAADAKEFLNHYPACPAYAADIAGETRKALNALQTDPLPRSRYGDFVTPMVYGEQSEFEAALGTVVALAEQTFQCEGNGTQ